MAAKTGSRKAGGRRKAAKVQDLTDRSSRGAEGGAKGEAYTFEDLSSSLSGSAGNAIKALGDALATAARKG